MARSNSQTTPQILPPEHRDFDDNPDTPGVIDDNPLLEDDTDFAESCMSEFNASPEETRWRIKAYRVPTIRGEPEAFLFDMRRDEIEAVVTKLRDEYGTGKYHIRIYAGNRLRKRFTIAVEQSRQAPVATQIQRESFSEIMQAIHANQNQMRDMVRELVTARAVAPENNRNPINDLRGLSEIIRNLQPPAVTTPQMDMTAFMATMANMFTSGMEVAAMGNRGGGETGFMDIAKELISKLPFEDLMKAFQRPPPIPQQLPQPIPPRIPQVASAVAPDGAMARQAADAPSVSASDKFAQPAPIPEGMEQFRAYLHMLSERAAQDKDWSIYGDLLLEEFDRKLIQQMVSQPNVLDMFDSVEPACKPWRPWFVELLGHIKLRLAQDASLDSPGDGRSGHDAGSVEGHAPVDAGGEAVP